jgi:flagellar biosynthesis chaperone FliJ
MKITLFLSTGLYDFSLPNDVSAIAGLGNSKIGDEYSNHDYHAILDALYDLYKSNNKSKADKAFESGILRALDFSNSNTFISALNIFIDHLEHKQDKTAAFKIDDKAVWKKTKERLRSKELSEMFKEGNNKNWLDNNAKYIEEKFGHSI